MGSTVLGLEDVDTTSRPPHYNERVASDNAINAGIDKVDAFAGHLSASFTSVFFVSGSVDSHLADHDIGAHLAIHPRVILDVKAFAALSGSGGVTRVDVQRQEAGVGQPFVSIFSNNAYKPAVSASLGNYGLASAVQISGTEWKAGTILRAKLDTVATALQQNLTVVVSWKPSASYGG